MRNMFKCPKGEWQAFSRKEKEAYNLFYNYILTAALELEIAARDPRLKDSKAKRRDVARQLRLEAHAMAKVAATLTTSTLAVYDES